MAACVTYGIAPLLCLGIIGFLAWTEPRFFSRLNLLNLSRNFSLLSLVAVGQAVVMIVGGFDMTVGSGMALAAIVQVSTMNALVASFPAAPVVVVCAGGVFAALVSGAMMGLANGLVISRFRIVPFMATLAMMYVVAGGLLYYTKGVPLYGVPDDFVDALGRGTFLDVPLITWTGLVVSTLMWILLQFTPIGRHIYAVGGNAHAARASGVSTNRVLVFCYLLSALCAALAGILWTARLGTGEPTLGSNTAIESIAAAVLGGVSLRGGSGGVWRVTIAALFLALVSNALNLLQIDSKWQTFVLGLAVIVAVFIEVNARKEHHNE
ncbi:hypothetical protein A6456_29560 [Paraburkholderia tropica]|nr:hypothetical protein A6456_29560 [Paraburkholderia tropica]